MHVSRERSNTIETIGLASLIALGMKFVSFLKYLKAKDWNGVFTLLIVWVAGIAVVFLAAAADVTKTLAIAGFVLGDINNASRLLLGMMLLSLGAVVNDFKKALDKTDSAAEPALLPPADVYSSRGEAVPPKRGGRPLAK